MIRDPDLDRCQATLVIGTNRTDDNVAQVFFGGPHTQHRFRRNHGRPNVEAGPFIAWHPVGIKPDQLFQGMQHEGFIDLGHAHTTGAMVKTTEVIHRPEECDLPIWAAERLQSLENLLCIVQDHGGRIEREVLIGLNTGIIPTLTRLIVHDKHAVRELLAEG